MKFELPLGIDRWSILAVILVMALAFIRTSSPSMAEDTPQPTVSDERVVRIEHSNSNDDAAGGPGRFSIDVRDIRGTKDTLYFPIGTDKNSPMYMTIKQRQPTDLFRVTTQIVNGQKILVTLVAAGTMPTRPETPLRPQVATVLVPNVYEFFGVQQRTVGAVPSVMVTLTRENKAINLTVPNRAGASGMIPDPAILKRVGGFNQGDSVEAIFSAPIAGGRPQLLSIEPFVEPIEGVYQGPDQVTRDGKKVPAIKITVDHKDQTIALADVDANGKSIRAQPLADKFAPGETLQFQLRKVGDENEVRGARFVGKIMQVNDHITLVISGGAYAYLYSNANPIRILAWMTGGPDENERFLEGVVLALRQDLRPAGLTDGQKAHMMNVQGSVCVARLDTDDQADLRRVYVAYLGAQSLEIRDQQQQALFWAMNTIEQRFWAQRDETARQLSTVVTSEQFRALAALPPANKDKKSPGPDAQNPPTPPNDTGRVPSPFDK